MQYALNYAYDGFAVFPVYEPIQQADSMLRCSCQKIGCRGKHPRTVNGVDDATMDIDTIKRWWTTWPNASIGIATGKISGMSVVDADGLEGILSAQRLRLVSPVTALTGNGKQFFYLDPNGALKNSVKKLAPGIDIRGERGYVVVPPSLHPNGKRYGWEGQPLSRKALSSIPSFFLVAATPMSLTVRKPEGWIAEKIAGMKIGNIDDSLVAIMGRLRHDGYAESDAVAFLKAPAEKAGATPGHVEEKAAHIWSSYQAAPQIGHTGKSEPIDTFLEDIKKVEWLCSPIVAEKSIGFVAGLPETMKTWVLIDLAIECARGDGSWLGLFPVKKGRVLFIDQERYKTETQRRFSLVISAKGLDRKDLKESLFLKCGTTIKLDLEASFQAFKAELLELRPDLVIIDSFATFHNSPENDRMAIQLVLNRIKQLRDEVGCAFWFINHESKLVFSQIEDNKAPNAYTMLGSVGIVAAAEAVLVVRKIEAGLSHIHHVKSTLATASKSFTVTLADVSDGIIIKGTI